MATHAFCVSVLDLATHPSLLSPSLSSTIQINRTEEKDNGTPNSEMRVADSSSDYEATVKAFKGADAVIHLAAIPNPVGKDDYKVSERSCAIRAHPPFLDGPGDDDTHFGVATERGNLLLLPVRRHPRYQVHNNNVNSAFIGFRAAAELGIKNFCFASSVNALGLVYSAQPLKFDSFP